MGWGVRRGLRRARKAWSSADLHAAAAMCAAQLPAFGLGWWIAGFTGDDYNSGSNGALGAACLLLFAPVCLPVLGVLHATLHITPAAVLAHLSAGRLPGPAWVRGLLWAVLLGVCWATLPALLWDWPFITTALVLASLGLLPPLGVTYVRWRARVGGPWGCTGLWLFSALVSFGLCVVVFTGGMLATVTGLLDGYEPPVLSAGQLAGVWRGDDGAVLRLRPGGRAESARLPAEPEFGFRERTTRDFVVCDGSGTWSLDRKGRDSVLVRLGEGCGQDTYWTIGGTEQEPELFVRFGDPDGGELRILTRD